MTANAAMTGGAFGRPLTCEIATYGEALKGLREFQYDPNRYSVSDVQEYGEDVLMAAAALDELFPRWNQLTLSEKESLVSICVLLSRDKRVGDELDVILRYYKESYGIDTAELDALVAKVSGQAESAPAPATSWKQDTKGWWVERADGSYLVSEWYQSPASGLWYYMGSDGYMLTNTTTPDGYQVNADGVWVQ